MPRSRALLAAAVLTVTVTAAGCSSGSSSPTPASSPRSGSSGTSTSGTATGSAPLHAAVTGLPVAHPTVWLCRPGMTKNPCEGGLDTTLMAVNGSTTVQPFTPATDPKVDCFYVYPTLSESPTTNAPLAPEPAAVAVTRLQASRFASVCRLFVPVYRQLTLQSLASGGFGDTTAQALASGDVDAAWHDYLDHDNGGRGVVLIGHSQGAGQVTRLIRTEVEKNPAERALLVSALDIGGNVLVPKGKDVGGSFTTLPACRHDGQTGCVVAYSSFSQVPPQDALFGRATAAGALNPGASSAGMQVLCTNPADLTGGTGTLQPYFPTRTIGGHLTATPQAALPDLPTGFVTFTGLRSECRMDDGASYLRVSATGTSPYDQAAVREAIGPTWGLHLLDFTNAYGNLVDVVMKQAAAWR